MMGDVYLLLPHLPHTPSKSRIQGTGRFIYLLLIFENVVSGVLLLFLRS